MWNKIPPNRRCLRCNSFFTSKNSDGHANWYSYLGGFICSSCYEVKRYHDNKKIRNDSTMEMSEILPVGSEKKFLELWP